VKDNTVEVRYLLNLKRYITTKGGTLKWIVYKIKNVGDPDQTNIKETWREGKIKVDFSTIISASFKKEFPLINIDDVYYIDHVDRYDQPQRYVIAKELIDFINNSIAEYYLLKK